MAWRYLLIHPPSWLKPLLPSTENETNILPVLLKQSKGSTNESGTPAVLPPPVDSDRDLFPPHITICFTDRLGTSLRVLILPPPPSSAPLQSTFPSPPPPPQTSPSEHLFREATGWQHLLLSPSALWDLLIRMTTLFHHPPPALVYFPFFN